MKHRGFLRFTSMKTACLVGLIVPALWFGSVPTHVAARQTGTWTLVYDRPLAGKYEDFAFPNTKHGWLISAPGEIFHSADDGVTWKVQASGKGRLRSIDFLDEQRGFAGTVLGVLYGTIDGGEKWTDITSQLPRVPKGFCGMTHVKEHVHVVGRYYGEAADYYFSPDGGKTWRYSDLGALAQGLVDVAFLSDSVGLIGGMAKSADPGVGPAIILKTTDGGKTWRPVFTDTGGRGFAWKVFPVSSKIIYAALQSQDGTYRVAKSTNAGDTWEVQIVATTRPLGPAVQGIGFLDEKTGWVGGFFSGMYATTDGGQTWTALPLTDHTINRFEKVGHTMFTAGTRGILRYDAGGGRK